MKRVKRYLKRVFVLLAVLVVMTVSCVCPLAFGFDKTVSDYDFEGYLPSGLASVNPALFDKVVSGVDTRIIAYQYPNSSNYTVYIATGATVDKILPRFYFVNCNLTLSNRIYWKGASETGFVDHLNSSYALLCIRKDDKFRVCGTDGTTGKYGNDDSSNGGIDESNEYNLNAFRYSNGVWSEYLPSTTPLLALSADFNIVYNSYKYGNQEKITCRDANGVDFEKGLNPFDNELSGIFKNWSVGTKILSPRDGFSQSQIDNLVMSFGYKVPWKSGTTASDVSVKITGYNSGTTNVESSQSTIKDGYVCGVLSVSGTTGFKENHVLKVTVTDAFGKSYSDSITINAFENFVDEDGDGFDDRAGDDHFDRYDPVGNPNINIASDLPAFIRGIKGFFTGLWGIIPEQLYIVIFGGITLLIGVAVIRAVL